MDTQVNSVPSGSSPALSTESAAAGSAPLSTTCSPACGVYCCSLERTLTVTLTVSLVPSGYSTRTTASFTPLLEVSGALSHVSLVPTGSESGCTMEAAGAGSSPMLTVCVLPAGA